MARDQDGHISNEILKEFNAECVIKFLKLILDKEFIFYLDGVKSYEAIVNNHKISYHHLLKLSNQRFISKEFHIQNINSYIICLKSWLSRFHGEDSFILSNFLA